MNEQKTFGFLCSCFHRHDSTQDKQFENELINERLHSPRLPLTSQFFRFSAFHAIVSLPVFSLPRAAHLTSSCLLMNKWHTCQNRVNEKSMSHTLFRHVCAESQMDTGEIYITAYIFIYFQLQLTDQPLLSLHSPPESLVWSSRGKSAALFS